ncbi:MAG: OmpA family protein [Bacteroidota bacterium]
MAANAQDIKAEDIERFFAAQKRAIDTRGLCVGSRDECEPLNMFVEFQLNSAELEPAAIPNIEEFAVAINQPELISQYFLVSGHTDASGSEEYNLLLSEQRAQAVSSILIELGVSEDRLAAIGFGEKRLKSTDPFSARNRRVEINLTGKGEFKTSSEHNSNE